MTLWEYNGIRFHKINSNDMDLFKSLDKGLELVHFKKNELKIDNAEYHGVGKWQNISVCYEIKPLQSMYTRVRLLRSFFLSIYYHRYRV